MKKLTYFVATVALLSSAIALADSETGMNRHVGAYMEGSVGTIFLTAGVFSSEHGSFVSGVNGYAWNVAAGYSLNPYFGLEGGLTRNSLKIFDTDEGSYYQNINLPYASMRFTVPIGQQFSFIAKLGVMYANVSYAGSDDNDRHFDGIVLPYTGIGVAYAVTPKVDITAQYQGALYGVVNGGALTAGVTYHF